MAAAALACVLTPATALAAPRPSPTPSAKELWRTYPLQATPAPTAATVSPAPVRARAAPAPAPRPHRSGGNGTVALLLALAAFSVAGAALWARRVSSRDRKEHEAPAPGTPPPDPAVDWKAEIRWAANGGRAAFRVTAESPGRAPATLAATSPVPWPPHDAEAIESVSGAVEALAADLLLAGWRELPAGEAWYARRFAWERPVRNGRFTPGANPKTTEAS